MTSISINPLSHTIAMVVVVGVGFEPTYATRADLQSAAFNHSATPPDCHLHHTLYAYKNLSVLRDKKTQLICQQKSRFLTLKNTKKQHSAKNSHRKRQKTNINHYSENNRIERHGSEKKPSQPVKSILSARKASPKPPQNGYFIWGRHTVFAALANPERRVQNIYVAPESAEALQTVLQKLDLDRRRDIPSPQIIERGRLDGVGGTNERAVHQSMAAAVWPLDSPSLDDFLSELPKMSSMSDIRILILDQLSDPRNVGAIMRSAHAFGVAGVITTFRNAAEENGVLAKAACGALDCVPLIRVVNLAGGIEQLQISGFTVAGLAGDASEDVSSLTQHKRLAIILGAEGAGLRRLSRDHCDMLVRIKIESDAESLNVSNAAAIALYAANLNGLPKLVNTTKQTT